MKLVFEGGGQTATLILDRKEKTLVLSSTKTNYKPVATEWRNLFDKGKEEQQEEITDKLSDLLFIKVIENSMNNNGYRLLYSKC